MRRSTPYHHMERRTPSAYVDLTNSSSRSRHAQRHSPHYVNILSDDSPSGQSSSSHDTVYEPPRGVKRRRLSDSVPTIGSSSSSSSSSSSFSSSSIVRPKRNINVEDVEDVENIEGIESVDLTDVNDESALSKALAKQREDAVKAQRESEDKGGGRSALTSYKCPVCMDTPIDATSTICGHLFCHKCIIDTLRFGEEQRAEASSGKGPRGNCPVCRKPLSRRDVPGPKRDLVPLQIKLVTKKVITSA